MSAALARWRLALRMARRDVRRSKGRSALVAVMVGTPVMLAVMLSTLYATDDVTPLEDMTAQLGSSDARLSWHGYPIEQSPDGQEGGGSSAEDRAPEPDPGPGGVRALLPGAEILEVRSTYVTFVGRAGTGRLREVDTTPPMADGLVDLTEGRTPERVGEIVLTPHVRDRLDAALGETVDVAGRDVTVVGVGTFGSVDPNPFASGAVGFPGTFDLGESDGAEREYLVDRDAPVTWEDVKRLNSEGFWVISRHVLENPPPASARYDLDAWDGGRDTSAEAVLVIIVTAVLLQVVLLAGPAFAVGARRQRRDLALLAAAGGTPADVRRTVLAQAAVLGAGSSVVGAALGLALSPLVIAVLPRWFDEGFGPYDVMWPAVVVTVVLGVVASLLAALVPARQVANQDVTAALVGRRAAPSRRNGWPLVGLVLVAVGLGVCFTAGIQPGGETAVAASTVAIVLGTVFLTPLVIGLVGRVGGRMPLTLRLAVRDTARQRSRSTPAIAAVMATVAGLTALAIANASDFEHDRRSYEFTYPLGTTMLSEESGPVDTAAQAAGEAARVTFTPIGTAGQRGSDAAGEGWIDVAVETEDWGRWDTREVAVATPEELAGWGIELTPEQGETLRTGGALVAGPSLLDGDGRVTLGTYEETSDGASEDPRTVALDGSAADLGMGAVPQGREPVVALAVIAPQTAQAQAIPYERSRALADSTLTAQQLRDVRAALRELPGEQSTWTEQGFDGTFTVQLLLLVGAGGIAVLIGTLSATGLALADARPDFATLAAVGAGPRTRRGVAAAQAVVLGALGALLGVLVGFAPGLAAAWPLTSGRWGALEGTGSGPVIDVPWGILATLVFVVPLIAAVASAIVTRGRVPLTRRLAQ
ncbi:FtsX-like permease family protein [Mumia sp. zg.B21]|uniref:FtsX-like permease family protein n=1 Tax=Mumia sp. zg.B21 TaxID=2855447 RepID=UPI001C6F172B|nr:FtsX-like permease family protein [Mumia sp. zg.B21]MBW9210660.1 FtsX-like permease family protein [Mumia sp. zg.B21]